jgi:hypothetical protein
VDDAKECRREVESGALLLLRSLAMHVPKHTLLQHFLASSFQASWLLERVLRRSKYALLLLCCNLFVLPSCSKGNDAKPLSIA